MTTKKNSVTKYLENTRRQNNRIQRKQNNFGAKYGKGKKGKV